MKKPHKASMRKARLGWTIIFRHPGLMGSDGKLGLRVHRGLGNDETEATKIVDEVNKLLAMPECWVDRTTVQGFSERALEIFYEKPEHLPVDASKLRLMELLAADATLADRLLRVAEPFVASDPIRTAAMAFRVVHPLLIGRDHEALVAIALDRKLQVIGSTVLTTGSDGFTVVEPRQIFRWALLQGRSGAHAVILAHNHPSQDVEPSSQDIEVTRRVALVGRNLGIALTDHLVVTDDKFFSLAERGHLPSYGN